MTIQTAAQIAIANILNLSPLFNVAVNNVDLTNDELKAIIRTVYETAREAQPRPFTFHSDPGHGWLEVTPADLAAVGLSVSDFTPYSYQSHDGAKLYLEEDCDAGTFIDAWKAANQREFTRDDYVSKYAENTFIRNLPHLAA